MIRYETRRYEIRPIADEHCDTCTQSVVATAGSARRARKLANSFASTCYYGVGIVDTLTGKIDVGLGFGVGTRSLHE